MIEGPLFDMLRCYRENGLQVGTPHETTPSTLASSVEHSDDVGLDEIVAPIQTPRIIARLGQTNSPNHLQSSTHV